jgi:hypothetical protein
MWYLARHREQLSDRVTAATQASDIRWLSFPSIGSTDVEWRAIDFVDQPEVRDKWTRFWPHRGNPPNWDAVGVGSVRREPHWLLVEAKAHTGELRSDCAAVEAGGLPLIRETLASIQRKLGVDASRDWLRGYYQFCNRLAVLSFLLEQGVAAKLALIYFVGDVAPGRDCPKTEEEWLPALDEQDRNVGLPPQSPLRHAIHKVFLPAFTHVHV